MAICDTGKAQHGQENFEVRINTHTHTFIAPVVVLLSLPPTSNASGSGISEKANI